MSPPARRLMSALHAQVRIWLAVLRLGAPCQTVRRTHARAPPTVVSRLKAPATHQTGWLNTVTGGSLPLKRSTSAVPVWPQLPCASREVASPVIRLLTSP